MDGGELTWTKLDFPCFRSAELASLLRMFTSKHISQVLWSCKLFSLRKFCCLERVDKVRENKLRADRPIELD